MKEHEEYHPIDLLKHTPTEIGRERVEKMISAFPILPPPTDWSSFINLNSILMTSIGTIILAGTIGFFSGESSANTTEVRQYQVEQTDSEKKVDQEDTSMSLSEDDCNDAPSATTDGRVDPQQTAGTPPERETPEPVSTLGPGLGDSTDLPPTMTPRQTPPATLSTDLEDDKRTFDLSGFTAVKLAGSHDVSVTQGPFSVTATGDEERLEKLKIEVKGSTLHISSENDNRNWTDKVGKENVRVEVSLPDLDGLSLAGSGNMDIGAFSGISQLDVSLSGSGNLTAQNDLEVDGEIDVSLAGSGDILLRGSATSVDISLAGSGDITAKELSSQNAEVSIAGSGDVSIKCVGDLDISIVGSGDVDYYGSPRVESSVRGSGDVTGH